MKCGMITNEMFQLIIFSSFVCWGSAQYEVPEAIIEVYHPNGFSVSIPDEEGIKLFSFHGKIHEELDGRDTTFFSIDILKPQNGLWTFRDSLAKLRVGDKIYYSIHVEYFDGSEKRGYSKDDQVFTVTSLIHQSPGKNKPPVNYVPSTTPTTTTTTTRRTTTIQPSSTDFSEDNNNCEPSLTVINGGRETCKGEIIFNEPFNTHIGSRYWNIENKLAGKPDYEFVMYVNSPETLFVADKALVIKPQLADFMYGSNFVEEPLDLGESCTGLPGTSECYFKPDAGFILPPVLSAKVTTKNKFSFKYGRIEVKAKLPKGDWLYPIITLNPLLEEYGPDYESGQIRIAFSPGNNVLNRHVHGGVILGNSLPARKYGMQSNFRNVGWSSNFYRFGLIWKEDKITMTVNDKIYGTVLPPTEGFASLSTMLKLKNADRWKAGSKFAPFDKEMYISIGLGVGGFNFEDTTNGSKPWKNGERLTIKKFHQAQDIWSSTWSDESTLSVASIKVWAL